jgi:hypothetical protein
MFHLFVFLTDHPYIHLVLFPSLLGHYLFLSLRNYESVLISILSFSLSLSLFSITLNPTIYIRPSTHCILFSNMSAIALIPSSQDPLPPGWEKVYDEQYKTYYYYAASSQTSTWEKPTESLTESVPEVYDGENIKSVQLEQQRHQIMLFKLRTKIGEIETMVKEGNVTMSEAKAALKVFTDSNTDSISSDGSAGETKTSTKEKEIAAKLGVAVDKIVCHIYIYIIFSLIISFKSSSFFRCDFVILLSRSIH